MKIVQPQFHNPIAETLLITVYMKAIESMKPNRILQDDTSVDIMNHIDYDFKKFENAAKSSVGVCLRAKLFDDLTAQFIESHKNPVIICVGCGLDTRRERLGKRGEKAIFYHLDFPEVIDLREDFIPESANNCYLRSSMLDTDWISTVQSENPWGDFLFVIEGVLMYLSEIQVKQFFGNIVEHFVTAELHFDVINKTNAYSSTNDTSYPQIENRRTPESGPRNLYNFWADYKFETVASDFLKNLGLGFGFNGASEHLTMNDGVSGRFVFPSYTLLNAAAYYDAQKFRVGFKVNNLTDETYYKGWSTINPQAPRAFLGTITYKF